jgi:tetratricopeptide (TPR) repeat protein
VTDRTRILQVLLVAGVAAAVYANALGHGFVVDDLHQVVDNPRITSFAGLPEVFSEGVWDFEGRPSSYYRPGMYLLYMGVFRIAGLSAPAFHAANVVLHAASSVLVVLLASCLIGRGSKVHILDGAPAEGHAARETGSRFLDGALAAGLLFAVHPIHTEPVNWVAGAADLGAAAFALAAVLLHAGASGERPAGRVLAGAAFLVAMLFKEPAVVLPAVLLVHDLLFRPSREARAWFGRAVPYAVALAIYLALRINALGGAAPVVAAEDPGPIAWARSAIALFGAYAWKTIAPFALDLWAPFAPPTAIADLRVLGGAAAAALLAGGAWALRRRAPGVTISIALFAVPLAPALYLRGLNQGIQAAFAERYLYLPSAGAVIAAAIACEAIASRGAAARRIAAGLVASIVLVFGAQTWIRNPVWRDGLSLWADAARRHPESAVARQNHGFALHHAKRVEEGQRELRAAVALDPSLVERDLAKGAHYVSAGLWKKAAITLQGVLAMDPRSAEAHFHLGAAYEGLGWTDSAEQAYRSAAAIDPSRPATWNNLGVLLATAGRLPEAAGAFEAALALAPGDPEILANLKRCQLP